MKRHLSCTAESCSNDCPGGSVSLSGASRAAILWRGVKEDRECYRDGCERSPRLGLFAPLQGGFRFVAKACQRQPSALAKPRGSQKRDPRYSCDPYLPESIPGRRDPLSPTLGRLAPVRLGTEPPIHQCVCSRPRERQRVRAGNRVTHPQLQGNTKVQGWRGAGGPKSFDGSRIYI